jgi:hypothetical protein
MKKFFSYSGVTGRIFEEEVLGHCTVQWDGRTYLRYREAMDLVRMHQPWLPTAPSQFLPRQLHAAVAKALGVDTQKIALYTAVGSPLDRFHSVDGFVEFEGSVVTIDVTINRHKDAYRADVILSEDDVENNFTTVAGRISEAFHWATKAYAHR